MLFRSGNWCWVVLVRVCLLSGATNESCNSDAKRVHSIVYSSFSSLLLHIFFYEIFFSQRERESQNALVIFALGLFDSSMFDDAILGFSHFQRTTYILSDLFYFSRVLLLFPVISLSFIFRV